jgi:photosystem II PsbY protein
VDSRALVFLVILGPALGWVAFNILRPGLNQINDMQEKNAKRKGLAAGVGGLSAAALMGMPEAADAATEAMQLADIDARIAIFGAFVPVLGWVGYNILKPGIAQLEKMQTDNAKKKGVAAGVGISAAALMGMPEAADAATEAMQLADIDARIAIFGAFVPVLGWVGYNILKPGIAQLEKMQTDNAKKKGVAAGVGISAAALMGMPEAADAATEAMQLADIDARIAIFGAFVPVLGWVGYNILKPGIAQLEKMQTDNAKKKGVAAGVGISAAALMGMPEAADAATEAMQLADIDARIAIFGAFVPVLGWVGYNILKPGIAQLEKMQTDNAKKKGVAAGVGISAAALMGMPEAADAATEAMQLADIDARIAIFGAFVPVLGWVGYNILKPGIAQLEKMQTDNAKKK